MTQAERLFLVPLLAKVIPAVFALIVYAWIDPIWFNYVKPRLLRLEDRIWERLYAAYWRRKGFEITERRPSGAERP